MYMSGPFLLTESTDSMIVSVSYSSQSFVNRYTISTSSSCLHPLEGALMCFRKQNKS